MKERHPYQIITVILFGLLLIVPGILLFVQPERQVQGENRAMAKMPQLQLSTLDAFPHQFDQYVNDCFPLRSKMLDISFGLSLRQHRSPIPEVLIGQDDFLFSGKEERQLYEGTLDFSKERMTAVVDMLAERQARLSREGIRLYVVVAPTAYEVYPERVPPYVQRTEATATDRFCQMMAERAPQVPFLYLKDCMLQHKKEGRLYFKNDNHWNPKGGEYAASEILKMMRGDFPKLPERIVPSFTLKPFVQTSGNLGNMLAVSPAFAHFAQDTNFHIHFADSALYELVEVVEKRYEPIQGFAYPWEYEHRFVTNRTGQPKIVVIRDSYAGAVIPFLAPWFRESLFIFDAWQYGDNWDIVVQEKPDIVLVMIYEPHIRSVVDALMR